MINHIDSYRELKFWQTAYEVTLLVIKLSRIIPRDQTSAIIFNQVIRSSASVGANIAEGFGRYKGKEYERYLQVALGSANETEYWLLILNDIYPQYSKVIKQIEDKNMESIKMLASSLRTLRSHRE